MNATAAPADRHPPFRLILHAQRRSARSLPQGDIDGPSADTAADEEVVATSREALQRRCSSAEGGGRRWMLGRGRFGSTATTAACTRISESPYGHWAGRRTHCAPSAAPRNCAPIRPRSSATWVWPCWLRGRRNRLW